MNKFFCFLFLCLLFPNAFSQQLKVISAVGGSATDNFYDEAIEDFSEAFTSMGVKKENQSLYFGGTEREGKCISTYPQVVNGVDLNDYRKKIISAKTCADFDVSMGMKYMVGDGTEMKKDCTSVSDQNIKASDAVDVINDLANQDAQAGDVIYMHIAYHGANASLGYSDWIIASSNGNVIKAEDLSDEVEKLVKKNVKVQLSFDACFSGGFTDKMFQLKNSLKTSGVKAGRLLCSSSSTASDLVGYGSDPFLKAGYSENYFKAMKKYGNQLSAVACASAADSLNVPKTTLDLHVKDYQASETTDQECFTAYYNKEKDALSTLGSSMSDIALKVKLNALADDFKTYYGDVMQDCLDEHADDQKIVKMMNQCIPKDYKYAFLLTPFLDRAEKAKGNDKSLIGKNISAIKSIKDEKALQAYLDEFCCLAAPLDKSKPGPQSCAI